MLFSREVTVSVCYDDLKDILRSKLDDKFFKGYFDRDDSLLYYRSDFLTVPGFTKIPAIEVRFKRGLGSQAETQIEFRIVSPILIFFSLVIVMLWGIYLFNVHGLRESEGGLLVPVFGTIFFAGMIFARYHIELSYFKQELRNLVTETTANNANK